MKKLYEKSEITGKPAQIGRRQPGPDDQSDCCQCADVPLRTHHRDNGILWIDRMGPKQQSYAVVYTSVDHIQSQYLGRVLPRLPDAGTALCGCDDGFRRICRRTDFPWLFVQSYPEGRQCKDSDHHRIRHIRTRSHWQDLIETLVQIVFAVAVGFVFTMTFYKGGSLWPCILAHSVIDVTSVFFSGSSVVLSWIIHIIVFALSIIYCIYLAKRVETPVINRVDMQQKEVFDPQ